jgi:hypothetical protein
MTQQIDPSSELFKLSQHYLDKLQSVMDDLHDSIKTLESAKEEFKKSKESKYVRFFYHPVIIVFLMLAAIIVLLKISSGSIPCTSISAQTTQAQEIYFEFNSLKIYKPFCKK